MGLSYYSSEAFFFVALSSSASEAALEDSPFPLFLLGTGAELLTGLDASDLSFLDYLV